MGLFDKARKTESGQAIDPVCKMTVDKATAKWTSAHGSETYYFCAPSCKTSFDRDPHKFLGAHGH